MEQVAVAWEERWRWWNPLEEALVGSDAEEEEGSDEWTAGRAGAQASSTRKTKHATFGVGD